MERWWGWWLMVVLIAVLPKKREGARPTLCLTDNKVVRDCGWLSRSAQRRRATVDGQAAWTRPAVIRWGRKRWRSSQPSRRRDRLCPLVRDTRRGRRASRPSAVGEAHRPAVLPMPLIGVRGMPTTRSARGGTRRRRRRPWPRVLVVVAEKGGAVLGRRPRAGADAVEPLRGLQALRPPSASPAASWIPRSSAPHGASPGRVARPAPTACTSNTSSPTSAPGRSTSAGLHRRADRAESGERPRTRRGLAAPPPGARSRTPRRHATSAASTRRPARRTRAVST